jgi:hypothetical protein
VSKKWHVIQPCLFQPYKKRWRLVICHTVYLAMSTRKHFQPVEAAVGGVEWKRKTPPASVAEFDTCNFLIEAVCPEFDPKRVLLRRVFFVDENKTRYISVGFYPAQNYRPMVEFGWSKIKPVILTEQHVTTMAGCLPMIYEAICDDTT